MHERKIGAHVSASGGLHKAIERAFDIGCNAVQLFSNSPRVWKKKPLSDFDLDSLFANVRKYSVTPIFTHALYLVNMASDKDDLLRKSFDALKYELEFDALIKGSGVVVHLGSDQGRGFDSVKNQMVKDLDRLLRDTPKNSKLLIENSAGQKGKVGSPLEEIQWLINELDKLGGYIADNRIGWCFDTCHAFASGYHLAGAGEVVATKEIEKLGLWTTLSVIHCNDSRDPFDSSRDRHENLGDGSIPKEEFEVFLNYKEVLNIPLILEVPGIDGEGPDAENIMRLKRLCGVK